MGIDLNQYQDEHERYEDELSGRDEADIFTRCSRGSGAKRMGSVVKQP